MIDSIDANLAAVEAADAAAANGADAQGAMRQPIRPAVTKAAELARDAENRARDRQHVKGKFTARERLDLLLDSGTFEEIGRFRGGDINKGVAGSAVITGFGEVWGRKVAVYAQDFSVRGGSLGVAEGRKICHLMDQALALRVPIIALIDSGGARIQEGVAALTEYGNIFRKTCEASGFVPQLSLILGTVRRRRRVLPGADRPDHHDPGELEYVRHRARRDQGLHRRVDQHGRSRWRHRAQREIWRRALSGRRRGGCNRLRAHGARLSAGQQRADGPALRLYGHARRTATSPNGSAPWCPGTNASPTTCST